MGWVSISPGTLRNTDTRMLVRKSENSRRWSHMRCAVHEERINKYNKYKKYKNKKCTLGALHVGREGLEQLEHMLPQLGLSSDHLQCVTAQARPTVHYNTNTPLPERTRTRFADL